jgi:hypothetical protein
MFMGRNEQEVIASVRNSAAWHFIDFIERVEDLLYNTLSIFFCECYNFTLLGCEYMIVYRETENKQRMLC